MTKNAEKSVEIDLSGIAPDPGTKAAIELPEPPVRDPACLAKHATNCGCKGELRGPIS